LESESIMKLFLTGATGFIGQSLVRATRRRGWQVKALVRDTAAEPARWLRGQGVELVSGDVTRGDGLAQAMSGCDVVLHNAGFYEFGVTPAAARRMSEVNVQGTDTVLGAALQAGVPRCLHVSSTMALGPSGYAPQPPVLADETKTHPGRYLTPYERSKAEAHQVALAYRARGLPLNILIPNAVAGVNDHSIWGFFLRMHLLNAMLPVAFARDMVVSFVEVDALAEGACLTIEKAPPGEDYLFAGDPVSLRELFAVFARHPGGFKVRMWMPGWFMRPQMALLEPIQRALGLPAFMSRDTVDAAGGHYCFSSAKAQRELGWQHPAPDAMWDAIVRGERALMAQRRGFLNRLRQQAVVPD
jgi:dihydroflavonol-4-reductase